ncbi:MAG: FecR domain-containing protein [Candidatus Omnitrophota bacterium]
MKRFFAVFFLVIAAGFIFQGLLFAAKDTEKTAKVIFVEGDVNIQKSGKVSWDPAKEGMMLSDGDSARTGKESAIEISFDKDGKNVIRLEESSTAILRGKSLNRIELPQGRIRSLVKSLKKEASFDIKTPTIVAGARGSGWDVIVRDNKDNVKAFEDEIFVQSYDQQGKLIKEIYVREGWEVFIDRFQAPGELIELTKKDLGDWSSWRGELNEHLERGKSSSSDRSGQFGNLQELQDAVDRQEDFKEQVFETEDIRKVEDRVADDNRLEGGVCPSDNSHGVTHYTPPSGP